MARASAKQKNKVAFFGPQMSRLAVCLDFLYFWHQPLSRILPFGVKPSAEVRLFWLLGSSPQPKIDLLIFDVKPWAEF